MALLPTVGPYLLPLVAPKIRKKLPRLELLLYEYQTGPMLDHLQAGDIDLGILALPVPSEGMNELTLFDEPFVVAVPETHELAKKRHVKPADLNGGTLLLLEDGHCLREQALDICSRIDAQEKQDFRATSLETLRQMVAAGSGLTLLLALSYSGRWEILEAVRKMVAEAQSGQLKAEDISEAKFAGYLNTAGIPDPELLIRTSGELRISNFLLWQIAYTELYITPTLWPDFRKEDLYEAICSYQQRERRFGKTSEQLNPVN